MNELIGKRLGSYQLLEQVGQGGMATIFKAYQPSMDRYVAVKVLPAHFTQDETFVSRFTQEARTLARLEHPHILPVHDYGEQEGITYLVMRYIQAGTLKDLIAQQGPMDLKEAARILEQVCRALGHAHDQGIIHRDIKPSNVLIDERKDAFLTDFGIAKLVAGTSQFTATGAVVGTPAYMSPEQGMGQPLDHRCDIYALGVMLYEMVTGQVPFDAETPLAILMKHVNAPLPPPRLIKPDLPEMIERVILKAMAKSPADRFQSAEEMGETLQRAVAGLPTEVALPPATGEATAVMPQSTVEQLEPPPSYRPVDKTRVAAPARKPIPWLPIAGGVGVLAVILIAALLILPNLGGDEAQVTPPVELPGDQAQATTGAAAVVPAPLSPGWTNYTNGDFVHAVARQGDYLWAGGSGGLVRWDLNDGSYVKFGVGDGLASNRVNDLLVDHEGKLWVATEAGINRFDGQTWLTFDEADGLNSNYVLSLFQGDDGDGLWAGTGYGERGLNYYDGSAWVSPPVPPLPLDFPRPRAFAFDDDYGLFVGLDERGLAHFDGNEWQVLTSEDGLPGDQVLDLLLVDEKTLLASFGREVVRFDLDTGDWENIPQMPGTEIYALHQDEDGRLWFAGEGGAIRYDSDMGDWQPFESGPNTIPSWAVTDIVEDGDGLWMGTHDGGVVFCDGSDWVTWATGDRLGGNDTRAIQQDGSGALWFVHDGSGLSRYDPVDDSWQTFGEQEGAIDWPSTPGVDSEGHLWVGECETLKWYDGQRWQALEPAQLAEKTVFGIAFGPGDVKWLWTYDGVIRHDPATDEWTTFTAAEHPVLEEVNTVYVASDGAVWVGGDYGLVRYDGSGWGLPDATGEAPREGDEGNVDAIAEAPDGDLWVASYGALYRLDSGQWSRFEWPVDWIETMTVGPDGTVWVGLEDLGHFDPSSGAWQTFTTADGLVSHSVRAIYVTPEGVVWVGTGGGVSRYVPGE
jgi:ligand-binding sensor domain-containing protein/tRNA A-37 threonylcarbamoyl transferase component Bud32